MEWKQPRLFILVQIPTVCPHILKQYFNLIYTSHLAFVAYLPFVCISYLLSLGAIPSIKSRG